MIFIVLGSQKFQFNRLLIKIDDMIEKKEIKEEVFAQIGYSSYTPKHFNYKKFISRTEFMDIMHKCDILVTHAGTGSIMLGVNNNKKVIAVPRLAKYKEHTDNHQVEICKQFEDMKLILVCWNFDNLDNIIDKEFYPSVYESGNSRIQEFICSYVRDTIHKAK